MFCFFMALQANIAELNLHYTKRNMTKICQLMTIFDVTTSHLDGSLALDILYEGFELLTLSYFNQ